MPAPCQHLVKPVLSSRLETSLGIVVQWIAPLACIANNDSFFADIRHPEVLSTALAGTCMADVRC